MEIKKINWFYAMLIVSYVILNYLITAELMGLKRLGVNVPEWFDFVYGEILLLIIAMIFMWAMKINPLKDLSYKKIGIVDIFLSVIAGYSLIPLVLFISNITMLFSTNHLNAASSRIEAYPFVVQLIIMAGLPCIIEELIFRGLFFTSHKKVGIFSAAILNGVIFGSFHLNINQCAYALVMGVIFSYMVVATESVWSSTCAHFAVNSYSLIMMKIMKMSGVLNTETQSITDAPTNVLVIQLAMLGVVAVYFAGMAIAIIAIMAKRHGTLALIKQSFRLKKTESEEKLITSPIVAAIVACIVFMIYIAIRI